MDRKVELYVPRDDIELNVPPEEIDNDNVPTFYTEWETGTLTFRYGIGYYVGDEPVENGDMIRLCDTYQHGRFRPVELPDELVRSFYRPSGKSR